MSDNLSFNRLAENQANAHTTFNDAMEKIDAAMSAALTVSVTNTNTATLTAAQYENNHGFNIAPGSPAPTAAITLNMPATSRGLFVIVNSTAFPVTVTIAGATEPAAVIGPGEKHLLANYGVNARSFAYLADNDGINEQTGTSYTLAASDSGKIVEMNNAAANTLTVPASSTVNFRIGTRIDISQIGAGQTTIAAAGGVTIRSKDSNLKIGGQYAGGSLYKRGSDEWVLVGDLTT